MPTNHCVNIFDGQSYAANSIRRQSNPLIALKFLFFMQDSNKCPCMVAIGSKKCSVLLKGGVYSGRGGYLVVGGHSVIYGIFIDLSA